MEPEGTAIPAPLLTPSVKSANGLRWTNTMAGPPKTPAYLSTGATGRPTKSCIYCSRAIAPALEVRFKIGPHHHTAHEACSEERIAVNAAKKASSLGDAAEK